MDEKSIWAKAKSIACFGEGFNFSKLKFKGKRITKKSINNSLKEIMGYIYSNKSIKKDRSFYKEKKFYYIER